MTEEDLLTDDEQKEIRQFIRDLLDNRPFDLDNLPNWLRELVEDRIKLYKILRQGDNHVRQVESED